MLESTTGLIVRGIQDQGMAWKRCLSKQRCDTYICQLADCICFYCDIVLLQFLLDFINALRDILCLKGKEIEKL